MRNVRVISLKMCTLLSSNSLMLVFPALSILYLRFDPVTALTSYLVIFNKVLKGFFFDFSILDMKDKYL